MVNLYSKTPGEINRFLSSFFNKNLKLNELYMNHNEYITNLNHMSDTLNILMCASTNINNEGIKDLKLEMIYGN